MKKIIYVILSLTVSAAAYGISFENKEIAKSIPQKFKVFSANFIDVGKIGCYHRWSMEPEDYIEGIERENNSPISCYTKSYSDIVFLFCKANKTGGEFGIAYYEDHESCMKAIKNF